MKRAEAGAPRERNDFTRSHGLIAQHREHTTDLAQRPSRFIAPPLRNIKKPVRLRCVINSSMGHTQHPTRLMSSRLNLPQKGFETYEIMFCGTLL